MEPSSRIADMRAASPCRRRWKLDGAARRKSRDGDLRAARLAAEMQRVLNNNRAWRLARLEQALEVQLPDEESPA